MRSRRKLLISFSARREFVKLCDLSIVRQYCRCRRRLRFEKTEAFLQRLGLARLQELTAVYISGNPDKASLLLYERRRGETSSSMNERSVFISCVSPEFRRIRSRVAAILTRLGYTPVFQEIFGTEPGDLRQVLRDKIDACEGLIQIVGYGYGAEPPMVELTTVEFPTPSSSSSTPARRRKRRGSSLPETLALAIHR